MVERQWVKSGNRLGGTITSTHLRCGGFQTGVTFGETDEFGFGSVGESAHVRDIHATILHQLGIDHERLSVRFQGLDVRLTGVLPAKILKDIV